MARTDIGGVSIHYEVLGEAGPWVSLTGGGRSGIAGVQPLGRLVAAAGYRILLHDRSNCGASGLQFDSDNEQETWADELHVLLRELDALPAFVGGGSSGARMSLLLERRHPGSARGLLLWRPSGGPWAAEYLARSNHDEFIAAATAGGMAAVCETPFMKERIAAWPANRGRLTGMDAAAFVAVMQRWRAYFTGSAAFPLIGMSEEDLRAIAAPCCVVAGQDDCIQPVSERLRTLLPDMEMHYLVTEEQVAAVKAKGGWSGGYASVTENNEDLARVFLAFMQRLRVAAPA